MKNKIKSNETKNDSKKIKKFLNVIYVILLILSSLIFSIMLLINQSFKMTKFDRILYTLLNLKTLNYFDSIYEPIIIVFSAFVIILCILMFPLVLSFFFDKDKYIKIRKKKIRIYPFSLKYWSFLCFGISLIVFINTLNVGEFLINTFSHTNIYDEYYVDYKKENIKFPDKKRNLITIYVESLENSVFSKENGGASNESYMPILEKLTDNYINFSNTEKIGGFYEVNGTGWTAAALVSQTAGIPTYVRTKNKENKFLDGAISIGEILKDNGYKNYFLMGSDADFADRRNYFSEHGNYDIIDYPRAIDNGWLDENYYMWWGFEDFKLYNFAKNMLVELSMEDEPFNFSILTADTHFFEGFVDISCPKKFDSNYANSFYCTDIMLSNFIEWIKLQPFYENTTIVIVGDHLTMRDDFFDIKKDYDRTVYNLFINSSIDTNNTKNRDFSGFDILPTTLASIGADIENDRLALGTNMFSNKKTLVEELGINKFNKEIIKSSKFYKNNIIKN